MSSLKPNKDATKSKEWLSLPNDLKQKLITAYQETDKASKDYTSNGSERLMEADHNCKTIENQIHKALGINLEYLPPTANNLQSFTTDLKHIMKTGYNIFNVEKPDPLMEKINDHMAKFETIKKAALKIADQNIEKSKTPFKR